MWIKWKIYEWCNFSTSIAQRNFRPCMSEFTYTYWFPVFLSLNIAWVSKHDFWNWKHTVKKQKRNFSKHLKDTDEQLWIVALTVLCAPCSRLDLHRCKGKFPDCSIARTWHALTKTEQPNDHTVSILRWKKTDAGFQMADTDWKVYKSTFNKHTYCRILAFHLIIYFFFSMKLLWINLGGQLGLLPLQWSVAFTLKTWNIHETDRAQKKQFRMTNSGSNITSIKILLVKSNRT